MNLKRFGIIESKDCLKLLLGKKYLRISRSYFNNKTIPHRINIIISLYDNEILYLSFFKDGGYINRSLVEKENIQDLKIFKLKNSFLKI